jgi:hypothetical protein
LVPEKDLVRHIPGTEIDKVERLPLVYLYMNKGERYSEFYHKDYKSINICEMGIKVTIDDFNSCRGKSFQTILGTVVKGFNRLLPQSQRIGSLRIVTINN